MPSPAVKLTLEISIAVFIVGGLLGGVWAWSEQPFPERPPMVIIESSSMMQCTNGPMRLGDDCQNENYGRIGSIEPGDLVIIKKSDTIQTYVENGAKHYDKPGDVIVYQPNGNNQATPIIHRAMFWLEINSDQTYNIPALHLYNITTIENTLLTDRTYGLPNNFLQQLTDKGLQPKDSGYVTKGDNNNIADQLVFKPVQPEWIIGTSHGEIPWLGLIKLKSTDIFTDTTWFKQAPTDTKIMLGASIGTLIGITLLTDVITSKLKNTKPDTEKPDDDQPQEKPLSKPTKQQTPQPEKYKKQQPTIQKEEPDDDRNEFIF